MKRILTLILMSVVAAIPVHAIALVGSWATASGLPATTITLPSVATGTFLVFISWDTNGTGACSTITSVSDNVNGTWPSGNHSPGFCNNTGVWYTQLWYLPNSAASAGTLTVTVTYSSSPSSTRLALANYSGVVTSSPLDGAIPTELQGGASVSTIQAPSVTTANANDLLIAYMGSPGLQTVDPTIDQSFTERFLNGNRQSVADRIVSSTGTFAPTFTLNNTASNPTAGLAAFKGSAVATTSIRHRVIQK